MTEVNLFDALEICLQSLDRGADLESCLALFPALAEDLRPILAAAIQTRAGVVSAVPQAAIQRGKNRLLQAAAEMRARGLPAPTLAAPRKRGFIGTRFLRLTVTALAMLVFLLTGGTGLVNASSSSIPGDRLYPVKRSWEGVRLFFVFDNTTKQKLEVEFDNERVKEIHELYTVKRIERVDFQGVVQSQANNLWVVGGLNVVITPNTGLGAGIQPGDNVEVIGETEDGQIKAEEIILAVTPWTIPTIKSSSSPDELGTPEASEVPESLSPEPEYSPEPENTLEAPEATQEVENTQVESGGGSTPEISEPTQKPEGGTESKATETNHEESKATESSSEESK